MDNVFFFFDGLITTFTSLPFLGQLVTIFVFSALVGSFLNVVIYRMPIIMKQEWEAEARSILSLPTEEVEPFSLILPRSRCRDCGRGIAALENIPVISYLMMRGKCRGCGSKISIFYPVVELFTALLATFVFWRLGANLQGFFAIFLIFSLVALSGIDIKEQILPDIITMPLMWAGIILSFWQVYLPLKTAVLGALISYLSLWSIATLFKIIRKKEGMGMGDAKLLAAIFTWVHVQYFPLVLMVACVTGLTVTVLQRLLSGTQLMKDTLPFGPYLALGGVVALLYGHEITEWYSYAILG